eukprot:scaffold80721_cov59-Phaeocystis_antarctica.AAC.8
MRPATPRLRRRRHHRCRGSVGRATLYIGPATSRRQPPCGTPRRSAPWLGFGFGFGLGLGLGSGLGSGSGLGVVQCSVPWRWGKCKTCHRRCWRCPRP